LIVSSLFSPSVTLYLHPPIPTLFPYTTLFRSLSFRVRHPAATICRSDSVRYLPSGLTRWKLYLLRLVSTSGLLAYFSFVRSLWASILPISGPLYFANRIIAYCAFSMLNPSVSARQCHIPARQPVLRPPDTAVIPAAIFRKDWIRCRSTHTHRAAGQRLPAWCNRRG